MSARIGLVFRTVGERTSDAAFDLAVRHVRPHQVHVVEGIRPIGAAMRKMLELDHECDTVVFADADCLITADISAFLRANTLPYVDSIVLDGLRGHVQAGVHVTRIDVVRAMRELRDMDDTPQFVVEPEGTLRRRAMRRLGLTHACRPMPILHDHLQYHGDLFTKYARRAVRHRDGYYRLRFDTHRRGWQHSPYESDRRIVEHALADARLHLPAEPDTAALNAYFDALPGRLPAELGRAGLAEKAPLTRAEVAATVAAAAPRDRPPFPGKVFGIGLMLTGTAGLCSALNRLGLAVPFATDDWNTLHDLRAGRYDLSLLRHFDGAVETVTPFFAQLDRAWPGSKFILLQRDLDAWLADLSVLWGTRELFAAEPSPSGKQHHLRWLHRQSHGTCGYDPDRLARAYTDLATRVREHFRDRPGSLLTMDPHAGDGWERLCPFLGLPPPDEPFPAPDASYGWRLGRHGDVM
ncbi:sulfotransferase [Nonomuraea sp. NPDC050404]|uniref:sulfotransferase n=1 Tax=Nonomuraea sp. NPDC050404 TaxID=3155783 RepID=UPI0033FDA94D